MSEAVDFSTKFRSSDTVGQRGGRGEAVVYCFFGGLAVRIFLATLGVPVLPDVVTFGSFLLCLYFGFYGIPDFYRRGNCPHCQADVLLEDGSSRGISCPGCQHRLVLRGHRIYDVTG